MNTIEPTAYTVKDPGNGKPRRYKGNDLNGVVDSAKQVWEKLVSAYPALTSAVVPDHFIQEYCQRWDSALWSGGYPGDEMPASVMLKLLEVAAGRGDLNFISGKV